MLIQISNIGIDRYDQKKLVLFFFKVVLDFFSRSYKKTAAALSDHQNRSDHATVSDHTGGPDHAVHSQLLDIFTHFPLISIQIKIINKSNSSISPSPYFTAYKSIHDT